MYLVTAVEPRRLLTPNHTRPPESSFSGCPLYMHPRDLPTLPSFVDLRSEDGGNTGRAMLGTGVCGSVAVYDVTDKEVYHRAFTLLFACVFLQLRPWFIMGSSSNQPLRNAGGYFSDWT